MNSVNQHAPWNIKRYSRNDSPDSKLMRELCSGETAIAVFKNALPESLIKESQCAIERFRTSANTTDYVNGSLTTIGPYLAKHLNHPEEYFASAQTVEERLFKDSRVPSIVRELLSEGLATEINVASESDGRKYAGAIVRLHANGVSNPLHNDNIMRDARETGLAIAKIKHQLSCVVCLQECTRGGELHHYQRAWDSRDERFKISNGLGYDEQVVSNCPSVKFKPSTGDVYVMNPTYYHSINAVSGAERRTLGFFFGAIDEELNDWIAWS